MKYLKFLVFFLILSLPFSNLCAQDDFELSRQLNTSETLVSRYQPRKVRRASKELRDESLLNSKGMFTQFNVGVGFLYFSGVNANCAGHPGASLLATVGPSIPMKGRLSYNKRPLYEYIVGYRFQNWFRAAISYQLQQEIVIQSNYFPGSSLVFSNFYTQFRSYLEFNTLMAKFYLTPPKYSVCKGLAVKPYLGLAIGGSWQSWTDVIAYYFGSANGNYEGHPLDVRQKIIANVAWGWDAGFEIKKANPQSNIMITAGCKYNQLGQGRNIGKVSQQQGGRAPYAFYKPLQIKTIYQFAPYLGAQWNFPESTLLLSKKQLAALPFLDFTNKSLDQTLFFTQLNMGPNFLYFHKLRADFGPVPAAFFPNDGAVTYKGKQLRYNKTPLFEYIIGFQPLKWFKYALSYQNQQGVSIETPALMSAQTPTGDALTQARMILQLNSIMTKFYFQFPYYLQFRKAFGMAPYLALGIGAGWQSWVGVKANRGANESTGYVGSPYFLRQKISANLVWMVDGGINFTGFSLESPFALSLGCKYNQWGQARNIGKMTQQGNYNKGWSKPLTVKTLYSFAPYLGMQMNFPVTSKGSILSGKDENGVIAIIRNEVFQGSKSLFLQGNIGIGLLYFSKVSGNLGPIPAENFRNTGSVPYKNKLRYNKTPLFEYLLGYRFNQWFKLALSYQTQTGVFVESNTLRSYAPIHGLTPLAGYGQLKLRLGLNALQTKVYLELPDSLTFKSCVITPYIAAGAGIGWQSWTAPSFYSAGDSIGIGLGGLTNTLTFKQKFSANFVFIADAGLKIQNLVDQPAFSVLAGCKYNNWGQARSIGKLSQQAQMKNGFFKPFKIRTVYQFAPYLGVQWNF